MRSVALWLPFLRTSPAHREVQGRKSGEEEAALSQNLKTLISHLASSQYEPSAPYAKVGIKSRTSLRGQPELIEVGRVLRTCEEELLIESSTHSLRSKARLIISVRIIALTVDSSTVATSFAIFWVRVVTAQAILFLAKVDASDTLIAELTDITGERLESSFELAWVRCIAILSSGFDATSERFVRHVAEHGRRLPQLESDSKWQAQTNRLLHLHEVFQLLLLLEEEGFHTFSLNICSSYFPRAASPISRPTSAPSERRRGCPRSLSHLNEPLNPRQSSLPGN